MKWYKIVVPAAVGIAVGAVAGKRVKDNWLVPEVALNRVKEEFKQDGPISGSWILMDKKGFSHNGKSYQVYEGGVTRTIDGKTEQFQFIVDATNGTLLDSYPLLDG
ncbi:putative small secreted protein [Alkalibacillus flavidus]|uniref:Small secreted protein n=1 Tax=Alkalibacillus flavidus TaxID=546021 RepID=A0ABV2KSX2_9BACI